MTKVRYTLIFFILFTVQAFSQDTFKIKFKRLELLKKGFRDSSFTFNINGIEIQPDTEIHEIEINKNGLDTIVFSFNKNTEKRISYAKFQKNSTYIIEINPCSQYTLFPEKNPKIGRVKLRSKSKNKKLAFVFCTEYVFLNKIDINKYYSCYASGMCKYSSKEIKITKNESEKHKNLSINFHFLHGENILVNYNKKLSISIIEYI